MVLVVCALLLCFISLPGPARAHVQVVGKEFLVLIDWPAGCALTKFQNCGEN